MGYLRKKKETKSANRTPTRTPFPEILDPPLLFMIYFSHNIVSLTLLYLFQYGNRESYMSVEVLLIY